MCKIKKILFLIVFFYSSPGFAIASFEPPSLLLKEQAKEIPRSQIKTQEIQQIINEMYQIALGERNSSASPVLVGLAAPQLGILKSIILVDIGVDKIGELGNLRVFINPKIIWHSMETEDGREGCYSVDPHLSGIVNRYTSITIQALNENGEKIEQTFEGFTARIFQHEIDHLNGICFPTRVGKKGVLHWVEPEEYSEYRENWKKWPRHCPWKTWKNMREGKPYKNLSHNDE